MEFKIAQAFRSLVLNVQNGDGYIRNVRDLIYVRSDTFERALTRTIASEFGELNSDLKQRDKPYLLIGPGRWGSSDPWLGIPVKWAQISGVRCIVETDFADMQVDPSQGSHFFQNIMSFGIGYLTINKRLSTGDRLDVGWLQGLAPENETAHLRHISFKEPLTIALNGRKNHGIIMKPQISYS
jgi:hypothetical protein